MRTLTVKLYNNDGFGYLGDMINIAGIIYNTALTIIQDHYTETDRLLDKYELQKQLCDLPVTIKRNILGDFFVYVTIDSPVTMREVRDGRVSRARDGIRRPLGCGYRYYGQIPIGLPVGVRQGIA